MCSFDCAILCYCPDLTDPSASSEPIGLVAFGKNGLFVCVSDAPVCDMERAMYGDLLTFLMDTALEAYFEEGDHLHNLLRKVRGNIHVGHIARQVDAADDTALLRLFTTLISRKPERLGLQP